MREQGYDLVYTIWTGLYAPIGTPEPVLARLEAACERTMRHPDVVAGMTRVAQPILYRNRADFAAFSQSESEKFRALIAAATEQAVTDSVLGLTIGTHPENAAAAAAYRHLGLTDLPAPGPRFAVPLG